MLHFPRTTAANRPHHTTITRSRTLALLLSCLAMFTVTVTAQEKIGKQSSPLSVASALVWNGPISVCWEFNGRDADKILVRQAVANTWEAESAVRFTGWQRCSGATNIRINIDDSSNNPHTVGLGRNLDNRSSGMVLNFDFKHFNTWCSNDEPTRRSCVQSVAVHEFGHAMGFAHEQNRPDAACEAPMQGSGGNVIVGIADLSSVMNYCNPQLNNNGKLSPTDVLGARQFYGVPPGTMVPPPAGSYSASCPDRQADATYLFATCRAKNGVMWKTALTSYSACKGDIGNLDGNLACGGRPLPKGSYQTSCRDMTTDANILAGSCRDKSGTYRRTTLAEFSACTSDIANLNGVLSCNKGSVPGGSYQSSCNNFNANNPQGTLFASCRTKGGDASNTYLHNYAACKGDISNQDGLLRCNNGLTIPSGSYQKSCNNAFNNSGELSAVCKPKGGGWHQTTLGNFGFCKSDIGNNNGNLTCTF